VVEAHHRREPLLGNVRGVRLGDQAVRVGRVADDQHLDVVGRPLVDRLALWLEDAAVRLQQVSALHPLRARPRTDQECDVRAVEGLFGVVRDVDATEQREGAVMELHGGSLGGLDRIGDLQQAQIHLGVRAEHLAGGDAEKDRVADLAGRSSDCDVDGGIAHFCVS
jgi:hypothetical protein